MPIRIRNGDILQNRLIVKVKEYYTEAILALDAFTGQNRCNNVIISMLKQYLCGWMVHYIGVCVVR